MTALRAWSRRIFAVLGVAAGAAAWPAPPDEPVAFVGATVIDGTGAAPRSNVTVVVRAGRIADIEPAGGSLPSDVRTIDAHGKFLLPGFVDGNVHSTIYRASGTASRYADRAADLAVEFAQLSLKHGVTTVRDSFGQLLPATAARDRIEQGEIGARMVVAGNIIGWGGPHSVTMSLERDSKLTPFQEQFNDAIAQGVGEDLIELEPLEIRAAVDRYLDKGPDFIKYAGTIYELRPSLLLFSPAQQAAIVAAAHARGVPVDVHAMSAEGVRLALHAGVDYVQHADVLNKDYPPDLIDLVRRKRPFCGIVSNTSTGEIWQDYLAAKERARASYDGPPLTTAERHRRDESIGLFGSVIERQRRNTAALIRAGCRMTISSDALVGEAPEFSRRAGGLPPFARPGVATLRAIEGLVELGMTPMQAIVSATRNGALATRVKDLGTVERGRLADLVLLDADPLADIRNIEHIVLVVSRGRVIDPASLPTKTIFERPGPPPAQR